MILKIFTSHKINYLTAIILAIIVFLPLSVKANTLLAAYDDTPRSPLTTNKCGNYYSSAVTGRKEISCQNNLCYVAGVTPKECDCQLNYCCAEYDNGTLRSLDCIQDKSKTPSGTASTATSQAVTFEPQIPLPGFTGGPVSGSQFGEYIKSFYQYFSGIVGILAAVMIVFAGFQWITAAGNASRIADAKTTLSGALIGLVLTLGAYVLLRTINPALVRFGSITPSPIQTEILVNTQAVSECPTDESLVDIRAYFPNSDLLKVSSSALDPRVSRDMIVKLTNAARQLSSQGMKLVITGAHRTMEYQKFLYDCYQQKKATGNCISIAGQDCGKCNEAAAPSCSSPHITGMAIDACVEVGADTSLCSKISADNNDPSNQNQTKFQQIMQASGFSRYCKEWWHFEAVQMSTPCAPGVYQ